MTEYNVIDRDMFTKHEDTLIAEASDLEGNGYKLGRVIKVRYSELTSHLYFFAHAEEKDGDLLYWDYKTASVWGVPKLRIFND